MQREYLAVGKMHGGDVPRASVACFAQAEEGGVVAQRRGIGFKQGFGVGDNIWGNGIELEAVVVEFVDRAVIGHEDVVAAVRGFADNQCLQIAMAAFVFVQEFGGGDVVPFVALDVGDPDVEFLAIGRPFVGCGEVARGIVVAAVVEGDTAEGAIKLAQAADVGYLGIGRRGCAVAESPKAGGL